MEQFSYNEEQWHNELERRCRDILDDALKGYPDYLWMNTYREEHFETWEGETSAILEMTLEFELQTGSDFGYPIFSIGVVTFQFSLTDMGSNPYCYGHFTRGEQMIEFTVEPLFIDTPNKTLWLLELAKEGWYNI